MAEETIEQMNRLLSDGSAPPMARPSMQGSMPMPRPEIEMITSAQQGLMQMDPEGTKDIVDGLEVTKNKVMAGGQLTEVESTGIMSILQKLGGALSGMMGGGADQPMQQVMVDGNVTMLTAKEIMSAINAGMLVQDVESGIRSMQPMTGSSTMTPDELMMESSGSTMTDAERAISANEEFNRRIQEEQEMMFRMNNPPVMSDERPRLRQSEIPMNETLRYNFPINPNTGVPYTNSEIGELRRVPKEDGIGYRTENNLGSVTETMEYVPSRYPKEDGSIFELMKKGG